MVETRKIEAPSSTDYRARLYARYVSTHLNSNAAELRKSIEAGSPYLEKLIRQFFPQDRSISVLDIGCGFGGLLHALKNAGYNNIAGVDRSPEQVQVAHGLGLDCVQCGDISEILAETADSTLD